MQLRDLRKLPSQTIVNPRENANAITLRREENTIASSSHPNEPKEKVTAKPFFPSYLTLPFPSRLAKSKKEEQEKEILDTFRKVEVNIPLLDAIKQVPDMQSF